MTKGLIVGTSDKVGLVYDTANLEALSEKVDWVGEPVTAESIEANPSVLKEVECIFATWGMPELTPEILAQAPNLKAIFYGAGSIRCFATDAFWKRNIVVTSAFAANSVPVAEWTVALIILGLKRAFPLSRYYGECKDMNLAQTEAFKMVGVYGSTIGLVSYGSIARLVRKMLRAFSVNVAVYDPFLSDADAKREEVQKMELNRLFEECDLVSLHTPWLPETEGMIQGHHIRRMKGHATFMNTSRGAIVDEKGFFDALLERPDLQAFLDVTWPEPPAADSPVWNLPNLWLTPHLAGSLGQECGRMGAYMVEEFERYLKAEPLRWQITAERFKTMA